MAERSHPVHLAGKAWPRQRGARPGVGGDDVVRLFTLLLCFNAGFVDAASFVSLGGLFTAHVTGNLVAFAAAAAEGRMPEISKLIAIPVFALVVVAAHLVGRAMEARGHNDFRTLLAVRLVLLAHAALVAITVGPFLNRNAPNAIMTGMTLVSAMALQNALHRTHLKEGPPSTIMTGTFTQILVDSAAIWRPREATDSHAARTRLLQFAGNFVAFVGGCALAAFLHLMFGMWCLVVPPMVAVAEIFALPSDVTAPSRTG